MISKNLFFNLMKENTKQRLWSVALIALILFFAFPVQAALLISSYLSPERIDEVWEREAQGVEIIKQQLQGRFLEWTGADNGMMVFLIVIFAIVCGVSGFSYLHSKRKTDFFHSIPIRREKLFAAIYINGVLYTAVPYLIFLVISCVMIQVKAGQIFPWGEVLRTYCFHMAFFLLVYAVVIAAVMMTGNTIVSILGTAVFFLWGPGSVTLLLGYYNSYYMTFYANSDGFMKLIERSSPIAWYISAAASAVSEPERAGSMALWAAVVAVLFTAVCVFLYKKRPSEAAGRAMAFRKSQPVIKLLLVVPFALAGSLFFKEMMRSHRWSIFGLLCGLVISYCVIEIIYNFDFRRLFAHKKQFVFCTVCAAAILVFFRLDLSGFDSYIPSEAKMEAAGIYCRRMDSDFLDNYMVEPELYSSRTGNYQYVLWNSKAAGEVVDEMRLTDTASAVEIGRKGVEEAEAAMKEYHGNPSSWRYSYFDSSDERRDEVIIAYHLKGGKTVFRSYYMNLSTVRDALDRVYDSEEYKSFVYPVFTFLPSDIAGINYQEHGFRHVKLKDDEIKARLLEAYQRELKGLTAQVRRNESPVAAIQFKTVQIQEIIDKLREQKRDYSAFNNKFYYPIYPSFTETISILKECGIEPGKLLTSGNVDKIVMEYYTSDDTAEIEKYEAEAEYAETEEDKRKVLTVTDKNEIQEILDSSMSNELNCTNYLNEIYTGVNVTAYVAADKKQQENEFDPEEESGAVFATRADSEKDVEEQYRTYSLYFDYDKIPEFVKETFKLTEENMKDDVIQGY